MCILLTHPACAATFNGICGYTIANDILVLIKQWGKLLISMFLSSASNMLLALIYKRKKVKEC